MRPFGYYADEGKEENQSSKLYQSVFSRSSYQTHRELSEMKGDENNGEKKAPSPLNVVLDNFASTVPIVWSLSLRQPPPEFQACIFAALPRLAG